MDKPDIKQILNNIVGVLAKLSVLKNNMSLLLSIIIAFVSILFFIASHFISRSLTKKMEQESIVNGGQKVIRLKDAIESSMPLEAADKYLQIQANDANEITQLALQTTQRKLLKDDIFLLDPYDANNFSPFSIQEFASDYRNGIEQLIEQSNAGDSPSELELEEYRSTYAGDYEQTQMESLVFDHLCTEKARNALFYARASDLSGYEYWEDYSYDAEPAESLEDCWYYQLGYWIIEDVFATINALNANYDNVLSSPVKRLLGISFTQGANRENAYWNLTQQFYGGRYSMRSSDLYDLPSYILAEDEGITESYTGRFCNDVIDVIHFNATFIIDTKIFFPLLNELCSAKEHIYIDESGQEHTYKHNQITILEIRMNSINPQDSSHFTHRYGDDSIVELEIIGEYSFIKQGDKNRYENLKPESIKELLAQVELEM